MPSDAFYQDFTPVLEAVFKENPFPSTAVRKVLAAKSGMSMSQIKIWVSTESIVLLDFIHRRCLVSKSSLSSKKKRRDDFKTRQRSQRKELEDLRE